MSLSLPPQVWKRKSELSPPKLLPALVRYNYVREQQRQLRELRTATQNGSAVESEAIDDLLCVSSRESIHHGIEYLEHCIDHQRSILSDRAAYNYLVLLHASRGSLASAADRVAASGADRVATTEAAPIFDRQCCLTSLKGERQQANSRFVKPSAQLLDFLDCYLPEGPGNRNRDDGISCAHGRAQGVHHENAMVNHNQKLPQSLGSAIAASELFDIEHALRVCAAHYQTAACVRIYSSMGLYEDAVKRTLDVDDLHEAKSIAMRVAEDVSESYCGGTINKAKSSPELLKRLWLMIAKHIVETVGHLQPRLAMEILEECPLVAGTAFSVEKGVNAVSGRSVVESIVRVGGSRKIGISDRDNCDDDDDDDDAIEHIAILKIEDILPFFQDFVTVDDFKDQIVKSLEAYDDIIAALKSQIDEYTALTEEIHTQMGVIRAQNLPMHASSMASIDGEAYKDARGDSIIPACALTGCFLPVGSEEGGAGGTVVACSKAFCVFPSGYAYRADALLCHVLPQLPPPQQAKAKDLHQKLATSIAPTKVAGELASWSSVYDIASLQHQFDGLIAAECPLTGNFIISSVDHSLMMDLDEQGSWEV